MKAFSLGLVVVTMASQMVFAAPVVPSRTARERLASDEGGLTSMVKTPFHETTDINPAYLERLNREFDQAVADHRMMSSDADSGPVAGLEAASSTAATIHEVLDLANDIIDLGDRLWTIIKNTKPAIDIQMHSANAMPRSANHWSDLGHWQQPRVMEARIAANMVAGPVAVDCPIQVIYVWGGNLNGHGQYLNNVVVIPPDHPSVSVLYDFSAKTTVLSVDNVGNREHPIAQITMSVSWSLVRKFMSGVGGSWSDHMNFTVRGDGQFRNLP